MYQEEALDKVLKAAGILHELVEECVISGFHISSPYVNHLPKRPVPKITKTTCFKEIGKTLGEAIDVMLDALIEGSPSIIAFFNEYMKCNFTAQQRLGQQMEILYDVMYREMGYEIR